jgi:PAS domain S-box-containing protein
MRGMLDAFLRPTDVVDLVQSVLEASTEYSIIGTDMDGAILLWNSGARRLYGYKAKEVGGKLDADVLHTPEDVAAGLPEAMRQSALADGKWEGTVAQVRRDGSRLTARAVMTPRRSREGEPTGFLLIAKDISEELRSLMGLEAGLLESAPDAMVIVDSDGRITLVNRQAERLFGYHGEELLDQPVEVLMPEGARAAHSQQRRSYLAKPAARPMGAGLLLYGRRRDGSEFPADISLSPLQTDGGTLVLAAVRDITDRRQTEEALREAKLAAEQANRAKSEYLSRMSHELRTPLNAILGFAQLQEMDELDNDKREGLRHILAAARHLLDLINEVLDIDAIEVGRLPLSLEPVAVAEVVTEAVGLMRPLAGRHGVLLLAGPSTTCDGHVLGDRQRLKQILLNLLSNAVKYNHEEGSARLTCERVAGERLRIAVTDTGPGIPPEMLERLFVPFERLGSERTRVEGTGLGLPLSKRLAEAMGGSLGVATAVDQGSTFWVEFPLTEDPAERAERAGPPPRQDEPEREQPSLTVLCIEDNLSNLRLVERILSRRRGIRLISAMRPQLGLDLVGEHHPDLVVLDLHLPDMPGEEVLRRLRADPETAAVPVVVLSADARPSLISRLLDAGARGFLTKPLDVTELLGLLDTIAGEQEPAGGP